MSFQQGLSGLNAASKNLDVIGNNVANASTVGFKQSQAQFSDVFANSLAGAGGTQVGIGTKVSDVVQQFSQGNITASSNPLDVAINGSGFFRLSDNGAIAYSRNGQFHLDKDGYIVNGSGQQLTGYAASAAGVINSASPLELKISSSDLLPQATGKMNALVNLDSRNTALTAAGFDINDPATYHDSTSVSVYDSLGNAHTLSLYFVKTNSNTWDVFASSDGTQIGMGSVGTLAFQTDGTIDAAATTLPFNISVPLTNGATSPLDFGLDLAGTTQFGSGFGVNALSQDGFTSGHLAGFSIGGDGVILGRYSNGQSKALGQVALANFANPQGLQPLGNNVWAETPESGATLIGAPNTGNLGVLQAGATEDSNVDLTAELVNMIVAQRIYQANAQSIKTQDAVLQTLVNMR